LGVAPVFSEAIWHFFPNFQKKNPKLNACQLTTWSFFFNKAFIGKEGLKS